jgi:hypothetical protein
MSSLIPEELLEASRKKYYAEHPTPAMLCLRAAKENPKASISELALIVNHSKSWVSRVLRAAGIKAGKRQKTTPKPDEATIGGAILSRKRIERRVARTLRRRSQL